MPNVNLTIENEVRHMLKRFSLRPLRFDFSPARMERFVDDETGEEYEEEQNPELTVITDGQFPFNTRRGHCAYQRLQDKLFRKHDGLIVDFEKKSP